VKVGVNLRDRKYEVELKWDKTEIPKGMAWWLVEIRGEPRPTRPEVNTIYRIAVDLAHKAMRARMPEGASEQ
jgi:hypothetical protein